MEDVSNPTVYATEIALNIGDGTSKATVMAGSCHSAPHDQFPLLCLISAYRTHMKEGSMSLTSDFLYLTDLVNTMFKIIDLRVTTKLGSWSRLVVRMLPKILKGTLPSTAFDAVKTDLTAQDAKPVSTESKTSKTRRTTPQPNRRNRRFRRATSNGLCEKYFLTGECKFGSNCWQSHNCPVCRVNHFPNCVMKKYRKKDGEN